MNLSLRLTIWLADGGFAASKQYCLKHVVQKSERATVLFCLYRARSTAAHCRHLGKLGSVPSLPGWKPEMMLLCAASRKSEVCLAVYWSVNVSVL